MIDRSTSLNKGKMNIFGTKDRIISRKTRVGSVSVEKGRRNMSSDWSCRDAAIDRNIRSRC